jgi:hypothetical protein
VADGQIRFVGWRWARGGGSVWRRIVDIERNGDHVGEVEACLTEATAAALATDLDHELIGADVAVTLMPCTESHLRDLLDQGRA